MRLGLLLPGCCYRGALEMKNCRRTLILAATLLVAIAGVACAEPTQSSPPSQPTASFWSWLTGTTAAPAKPRPAAVTASAPETANPRPPCRLLSCITLVGIGF